MKKAERRFTSITLSQSAGVVSSMVARRHDACGVDQHVQAAEARRDSRSECRAGFGIPQIGAEGVALDAEGPDGGCGGCRLDSAERW